MQLSDSMLSPVASESRLGTELVGMYRAMLAARLVDNAEAEFVRRGEAFFHISGEGHESLAALAPHLREEDWLACHYRDKALLIARGVPLTHFFATQLCRSTAPGGGRQLPDILCDPERNVLSMPVPVGNHALQAVGVAAVLAERTGPRAICVCSVGDGTTQQGEFLEAVAEAVRRQLPVLFIVEDNRFAISTRTPGMTFLSRPDGPAREFYGLPVQRISGEDPEAAFQAFGEVVEQVRDASGPALVWFDAERLNSHTNADEQRLYRTEADLTASRASDPLPALEQSLLASGISPVVLEALRSQVQTEVDEAAQEALLAADPRPVLNAKEPLPQALRGTEREYRGQPGVHALPMRDALRDTLRAQLAQNPAVFLTGQDIEDPKGDVFGVTRGLSTEFPGRVVNAPLSESTIIGTCIGRALTGQRPVAFLQFADFLPLAFNQIANELGSMAWRTCGGYTCPVVVMVACGGYKPGMGPFHAQTFESVVAHVPGIDVVMPSTAADAAGLLNAALASPRPTVIFYPKALLNLTSEATSADVERHCVPVGHARRVRAGRDLTLVAWGNTVGLSAKVADALSAVGLTTDLIDLRSLSPWDEAAVLASVQQSGRLLVVHEDNLTCGFGAEVVARLTELSARPIRAKRVTRPDTYVPCHYESQLAVLPSFRSTLTAAAELLDLDLTWTDPPPPPTGKTVIPAIGSGPSDEQVLVVELFVKPGQHVKAGDPVAEIEASKSVVEMVSPASGVVEEVGAHVGDRIPLGHPLVVLRADAPSQRLPLTQEPAAIPRLRRRAAARPAAARGVAPRLVGLGPIACVSGSRVVSNDELLRHFPKRSSKDVLRRTGIETRRWLGAGETVLTLSTEAARRALHAAGLHIGDLDLIICSSGTPLAITPSLSCRILAELAGDTPTAAAAYDINAACSGYLYALQTAYDFLQATPGGRALIVTAEALSTKLNVRDFDTAFLFGDAATATLLVGDAEGAGARVRLHRPVLSARGETGQSLSVPLTNGTDYIRMQGMDVFAEAVPAMAEILERACGAQGLSVADLDLIVPHQANQRILDAIQYKLERPVFSNIRVTGNTSSSSIPLALAEVLHESSARRIGLCAFGGGFTSGGAILECEG